MKFCPHFLLFKDWIELRGKNNSGYFFIICGWKKMRAKLLILFCDQDYLKCVTCSVQTTFCFLHPKIIILYAFKLYGIPHPKWEDLYESLHWDRYSPLKSWKNKSILFRSCWLKHTSLDFLPRLYVTFLKPLLLLEA